MRRPIIAGNWKMNKTSKKAALFVEELKKQLINYTGVEVVVCPPFTALSKVAEVLEGSKIVMGAQNMYPEPAGAYTGEISPLMLLEVGCEYVIIGHSERRILLNETDEIVNKKLKSASTYRLKPIFCLGESKEERDAGKTEEVIYNQLIKGLADFSKDDVVKMVIAYEPVWAIGTGRTATPEDANAVHKFIRQTLNDIYDQKLASKIRIQYGGSVRPDNIDALMAQPDIDGVLVGGASLDIRSFVRIVKFKQQILG
ncbi:MAG: triose-phosphate isomerase [bacterium]